MPATPLLRRVSALAAATGLILTGAVPAGAAAVRGWRVVQDLGPSPSPWQVSFSVPSADAAWATWRSGSDDSYVEQWDGKNWSQVAVPSSLAGDVAASLAVGASSATDAWLFGPRTALQWNGQAWSRQSLPSWVVRPTAAGTTAITPAVFGNDAAWVFSLGADKASRPDHYAAFYDGKTWAKVTLPGVPDQVSAVAQNDIWALGTTPGSASARHPHYLLMHWDGQSWATVTLPAATGAQFPADLCATGPDDVWLQRNDTHRSGVTRTLTLMNWNGKTWAQVKLKYRVSVVDFITPDGQGGIWLAASGRGKTSPWFFARLNGTKWNRHAVPVVEGMSLTGLYGLAGAPGSSTVWAFGSMRSGADRYSSTLEYTP
jgi:hypothetical protein